MGITTRNFPFWAGSISRDFPRVGNYTVEWAVTYLIRNYVSLKGCCFFSLSLHLFSHGPREKGEVHKPLDSHTSAYVSSPPLNHLRSRHLPGLESQSPECLGSPVKKRKFLCTKQSPWRKAMWKYGAYLGSSLTWDTYFCTTLLLGFTLHMNIPFRKEEGSYAYALKRGKDIMPN